MNDEPGASPRVRGRRVVDGGLPSVVGSIPARAGPTWRSSGGTPRGPEHPRACGADSTMGPMCGGRGGASPRVRGRPRGCAACAMRMGSIPARAGPTSGRSAVASPRAEHPRACGADICSMTSTRLERGASPRVRGRPVDGQPGQPQLRSIPARAGPTVYADTDRHEWVEHPRACGADDTMHESTEAVQGASPRVRGRHLVHVVAADRGRSIPARAGPTPGPAAGVPVATEHPRACGADATGGDSRQRADGASPRVRGRPLSLLLAVS